MRNRKGVILLALVLMAVFSGFLVLRISSGSVGAGRVPPPVEVAGESTAPAGEGARPERAPGSSLQEGFTRLKGRALAGDQEAVLRLFRETQYCLQSRRLAELASKVADAVVGMPTDKVSTREQTAAAESLGFADGLMAAAQKSAAACAEFDAGQLEEALPAALRAAQAGDLLAMNCYVGTDFALPPPGLFDHPEWLAEYKQHAPALMQKAIEHGDWAMVALRAMAPAKGTGWISQISREDPVGNYRYLRLLKLGASGVPDAGVIDHFLNVAARDISEQARRDADDWARRAFHDYFGGVPDTQGASRRPACELVGWNPENGT